MKAYENGHRWYNNDLWEKRLNQPYDYQKKGLVKHLLSHTIVNSENPVLQIVLQYYEKSLVFLMKYIDVLRNFKNFNWKNR